MGTSAASNATAEAIERGLSNRQAYALGAIAGFAEVLTEKFSLDALLDEKWEDGAIKYILKNAFTEGTEEVGSDLINWAGDLLVSRDKSQWKQAIKGYEDRGYSQGEAFGLALRDQAQEMGMDLLGGILSGGLMSGGNVAINSSANVQMENLVSDATAEDLLRNESMVRFLNKHGELKLEKGMTQEQKRAAIRQAVENVVHKEKAASGEGDGEVHYSLKAFTDGRRFVDVDTDQAQFDGLTFEQLGYQARRAIKKKFIGKVIGIENRAFVNGNTAEEYGHPVKKLSQKEHEAKMRASAELDNLLEAGTNFRTDPDGRDGHIHPKSVGDFRYFDTIFKVGSEYYEGVINIEHIKKGFLLKDITNIRNITQEIRASYGENPQGRFLRDASMTSIPPNAKKGNKEVSTTDGDAQSQQQDAQPLTQADAKRFATETGTENGLVLDDYVQKHLRPEKAKQLNTLAKALGVRVRFVNSIRGGTANASIRGSDVQIERYNPNPVTFLLGHELTHRMQSLSPEAYARFKEAIRPEVEKEAQALHSLYRIRGENIEFEGAIDEATANYAGRLLEKGPVLDQFIQRHRTDRSLLEKVLDAVRDMISKLTGTERKQAETAEAKLLAALEETAEKVKKSGGEVATADSRERYSLNENFSREVDQWLKETTEESRMVSHGYFQVGTTSEALKSIGVQDGSIFWRKQKIGYIMLEHPEMDSKTIKQVPKLIENPIVVLKSRTQESSIVLLGDVTAKNGERVMAALELTPKKGGGMEAEFTLLSSAYSRTKGSMQNLLKKSEILYLATDKRRTDAWLMQLRVQFPSGQPVRGPIGSISYRDGKVNIKGKTLSELGGMVM